MAQCHYCPALGVTRDHIVPKHKVKKLGLSPNHRFNQMNLVPCCRDCNQRKSNNWPTCDCERCREAILQFHRIALGHAA